MQGFFRGDRRVCLLCLVRGLVRSVFFRVFFREESLSLLGDFWVFCQKLPGARILLCTVHLLSGFPAFILLLPLDYSLLISYFLFLIPYSLLRTLISLFLLTHILSFLLRALVTSYLFTLDLSSLFSSILVRISIISYSCLTDCSKWLEIISHHHSTTPPPNVSAFNHQHQILLSPIPTYIIIVIPL